MKTTGTLYRETVGAVEEVVKYSTGIILYFGYPANITLAQELIFLNIIDTDGRKIEVGGIKKLISSVRDYKIFLYMPTGITSDQIEKIILFRIVRGMKMWHSFSFKN